MAKELPLNWDMDTLNKAYRQGYMAGIMGLATERCPYRGDIITAAWEAGWEDGRAAHRQKAAMMPHRIA